jgi:YD repeat-containing protein
MKAVQPHWRERSRRYTGLRRDRSLVLYSRTSTGIPPLTYDAENRLNSVTQGGQTTTFTYDGDGRRVVRDTVTNTIVYVGSHYEKRFPLYDLNADCLVNVVDIMLVVARWHTSEGEPNYDAAYDLNGDGDIDVADIMRVAAHWRETWP